ncbi:MAG: hypothetical protein JXB88_17190 [Spirochaetales bacterium]|nr:hypothetical protein [Spirochaetales bacterium]
MREKIVIVIILCIALHVYCEEIDIVNSISFGITNSFFYNFINTDNPLNPGNVLEFELWSDKTVINNLWTISISSFMMFTIDYDLSFFMLEDSVTGEDITDVYKTGDFNDYYHFYLKKLYVDFFLFDGTVVLQVGKVLPEYGVGYIWKPTNFLKNKTGYSKYLVDCYLFYNLFSFELLYAPNRSFIPDDYDDDETMDSFDDFFLFKSSASFDSHILTLLFFMEKDIKTGINYSVQLTDGLIFYVEAVMNFDNYIRRIRKNSEMDFELYNLDAPYPQLLFGINYTPDFIDWTMIGEFYYNGDGFTQQDWDDYNQCLEEIDEFAEPYSELKLYYLDMAVNHFLYNDMSGFYAGLHIRQNDKFFDHLNFEDTLFFSLPFGIQNYLTMVFSFDNARISLIVFNNLYSCNNSEFSFAPNDAFINILLNYKFNL